MLVCIFNKGLAGAPPDAIAGATDTAMNPAVLTAFALAIVGDGQDPHIREFPGMSRRWRRGGRPRSALINA